jgi:hypothetical protein
MNEMQTLIKSNPWIDAEERHLSIKKIYVCEDIQKWKTYDILLSTDKNDHLIEYNTLTRILDVMPQTLSWDGKFALGVELSTNDWRNQLKTFISNKNGTVCFLNFKKHKLTKSEFQIYIEQENAKKMVIEELLKNAKLSIENKGKKFTMSTSPDPIKSLVIGCPPNKCDVLMTRSEFIDAIPVSCLQRYVKENGVIIHFGRLGHTQRTLTSATYIDAAVLPKLNTHNTWVNDFHDYASILIS